ncbi:MAG: DoxX family protein [Armatimonadota bacterium]|nr:DoxX family protein [Armatimonadota bacterium]
MLARLFEKLAGWAPLPLRIVVGIIFVAHGSQKLFGWFGGHGFSAVVQMVGSLGFVPATFWAVLVVFAEFGGGILLILGLFTRFAAVMILINMIVAVTMVHWKMGGFFLPGGIEYALSLAAAALSLVFSGAGKLSIDKLIHWKL